eukprot:357922-Chlamydomonas_euryale.AAC.1
MSADGAHSMRAQCACPHASRAKLKGRTARRLHTFTPSFGTLPRCRVEKEEKSAEEIAADMERLALIRKRREDDRLKRIATEGWDRYAPLSETNHP